MRDGLTPKTIPRGGTLAVFKAELRSLAFSPLTYVLLAAFSVGLSASVFLLGGFYTADEASLRMLATFTPWVALIIVPALAMRAWSDVLGREGAELVLALPLSTRALVLGKFFAGVCVLMLALLLTAPLVCTVLYLGSPDIGAMAGTLFGCAVLLSVYYAVSMFASSFVREQVSAFIVSVGALFLLTIVSMSVATRWISNYVPARWSVYVAELSPRTWLDVFSQGLIDWSGLVFLFCFVVIRLVGTFFNIRFARRDVRVRPVAAVGGVLASAIAILVALVGAHALQGAWDWTDEREYTLGKATIATLKSLEAPTDVTLYWSASETAVPQRIKTHALRIERMLREMRRSADGMLNVRAIDPRPDTDDALDAQARGVQRVPMTSGDAFFLGATVSQGERVAAVPYFDVQRDALLEYDLALVLANLSHATTPTVGILSPLLAPSAADEGREGLTFLQDLKAAYDVAVLPFFAESVPDDLDVLLVLNAPVLKHAMLYAIDQFLMRGGRVIVMVDPYQRFNRKANEASYDPSTEVNDISDLLLSYGIKFDAMHVVGDASLASPVSIANQSELAFPFWLRLGIDQLSSSHPVTAGLSEMFMAEPGAFDVDADETLEVLLSTSASAGVRGRDDFKVMKPAELLAGFTASGGQRALSVARKGPIPSAFTKAPEETPEETPAETPHLALSESGAAVFAIGDVDWLFDPFSLQTVDQGGTPRTVALNDNHAFLLNLVEFASGKSSLISIRSRGEVSRPFVRVVELHRAAQARYAEQEQQLLATLNAVEAKVADALRVAGVDDVSALPVEFRDKVATLNRDLLPTRKALRDIRKNIREDVETLGRKLTVINLLGGLALAIILAALAFLSRRLHL